MGTPYGSGPPDYSNGPPSYGLNDDDEPIAPTPHNLPAGQQMRLLGSMDEPMYQAYVLYHLLSLGDPPVAIRADT